MMKLLLSILAVLMAGFAAGAEGGKDLAGLGLPKPPTAGTKNQKYRSQFLFFGVINGVASN